eukprot:TRINITY_DN123346_c0_g1_i1.p1 TRINITY_DN123346_c0_g1~~TRINITY_DN123346_c0_g1_i1.p1  ORF type:complete len:536 (+),score=159.60 TRINITY_DN123346_c0_g1_i1:174-1781(+)
MVYSLGDLLRDVTQKRERQAKGKEGDNGSIDFGEVWTCYVRYIKSCMEAKRGLSLSSFAKVGWKAEKTRLGDASYKPFFNVTEQFGRAYTSPEAMRKLAVAQSGPGEACTFEDFNFSKAAIKFSHSLTKDNVFTGLRALVQHIGEAIADGKELDVEFGDIGRLTSRDREPRFHFSAELYISEGVDPPAGAPLSSGAPMQTAAAFTKQAPPEALGLNVVGGGYNAPRDQRPAAPFDMAEEPFGATAAYSPPAMHQDVPEAAPPRALTPAASSRAPSQGASASALAATRGHVLTGQQFKREVAFKEAMDRHIGEMESRAAEAMQEKAAWSRHVDDCLGQEREEITGKRSRQLENQHFVKQQKLLNEEKRKEQRQEDIIAASAHDFPKFTEPAESDMKAFIKGQQARMRQDLDEQVRTTMTLRNLAKQRDRSMEINQLQANRAEMAMLRDAERAKKSYDKEALATAWNSEIRMKNIWKAIDNHNKVGHSQSEANLLGDGLPSVPPSRGGSVRSAGRLMTGSSRRMPLGASMSMGRLQG